jgi:hypothetical protein
VVIGAGYKLGGGPDSSCVEAIAKDPKAIKRQRTSRSKDAQSATLSEKQRTINQCADRVKDAREEKGIKQTVQKSSLNRRWTRFEMKRPTTRAKAFSTYVARPTRIGLPTAGEISHYQQMPASLRRQAFRDLPFDRLPIVPEGNAGFWVGKS